MPSLPISGLMSGSIIGMPVRGCVLLLFRVFCVLRVRCARERAVWRETQLEVEQVHRLLVCSLCGHTRRPVQATRVASAEPLG